MERRGRMETLQPFFIVKSIIVMREKQRFGEKKQKRQRNSKFQICSERNKCREREREREEISFFLFPFFFNFSPKIIYFLIILNFEKSIIKMCLNSVIYLKKY